MELPQSYAKPQLIFRKSRSRDKRILWSFYFHIRISYIGKTVPLYSYKLQFGGLTTFLDCSLFVYLICPSVVSATFVWVSQLWTRGPNQCKNIGKYSIGNPIVEIRRSYDHLISTMGFPIVIRRHLCIESGTRTLSFQYLLGHPLYSIQGPISV